MVITNFYYSELDAQETNENATLFFFAFNRLSKKEGYHKRLKSKYPQATIVMFSTAGHFISDKIEDDNELVCVLEFEKSSVKARSYSSEDFESDYQLGSCIGSDLESDAKALILITDGGLINGTDLIKGVNTHTNAGLQILGGIAGDGTRFKDTLVGLDEEPRSGQIAAVALFGEELEIVSRQDSGWSSLGLEFLITKSDKNKLIELNNKNAYEILSEFMHSETDESFTHNMLYYPFFVEDELNEGVIRTPIAVDHVGKTITYAGNMPIGSTVKLMKSRTMQLLDSTFDLANECISESSLNEFIFAISCVGRRVVLQDMANEEFVELNNVFGSNAKYFGFYS